jgi:predicted TIM-barrel fold metal-dependent hydrolase
VVKDFLEPFDVEAALLLSIQGAAVAAWTDPVAAAVFTTAANDYFIENWVEFDPRYKLGMTVAPHDPDAAAAEIRARRDVSGVIAVFMPLLGILMGNRHYYPIYQAAQECGMPIVVHPSGAEGCYIGSPPLAGGVPRSYAERHALLPQIGQSNLVSLVFEGVFERYPELKVVFVEFGWSWAVPLLWRMDKEWRNFRYDTPWLTVPPSEYARRRIRFATQPMDEPEEREDLWTLLRMMNAEQMLLFSSDYPHYDTDNPSVIISRLPSEMRRPIARDNALATFGGRLEIAGATA